MPREIIKKLTDNSIYIKAFQLEIFYRTIKIFLVVFFCLGWVLVAGNGYASPSIIAALLFVLAGVYYCLGRDIFINVNKTVTYDDAYIMIGKKRYDRKKLIGTYIVVGSVGSNMITMSYRAGLRFRGIGLLSKRKNLVALGSKEEATRVAQLLAEYLGCNFLDETEHLW
jgi:hypothetical protein